MISRHGTIGKRGAAMLCTTAVPRSRYLQALIPLEVARTARRKAPRSTIRSHHTTPHCPLPFPHSLALESKSFSTSANW
jgi:hypothetical protein